MRREHRPLPFRTPAALLTGHGGGGGGDSPAQQLHRGVHRAPYSLGGLPALVAISARGAKVAEIAIPLGVNELELAAVLRRVLEIVDPLPRRGPWH